MRKGKVIFKKYKGLLKNLGLLTFLKSFNLLLPLIIYPYLIRVLGANNYGWVVFAESIIFYFVIFISFGFTLSATKEVSIYRNDKKKVNEIVSSVYIIKGFVFLFSLLIFFAGFFFFDQYKEQRLLFLLTLYLIIYEFLFPFWFFQGIEKIKYITYLELFSKSVFFILIFVFVKSPDDYLLVPLIQGAGSILAIVIGFYLLFVKEKVRLFIPNKAIIKKHAKDGFIYFTSTLSIQIFTNSNRFLIGSFLGVSSLAFYDIVEKVIRILSVPTNIFRIILLPFVSLNKDKKVVRGVTKIMTLFSFIVIFLIFLFADNIIFFMTGERNKDVENYLKLYSIIILLYNLSNYYLVVSLNAFGYKKDFVKIMISSLVIYFLLILFIILNKLYLIEYFIVALILVELYIVVRTYIFVYKKELL